MPHPKDKALAALVDAIDAIWLNTCTHYKELGFAEAQKAWDEVHRDHPDVQKALEDAKKAADANPVKWGALRAAVEALWLAGQLPRIGQ